MGVLSMADDKTCFVVAKGAPFGSPHLSVDVPHEGPSELRSEVEAGSAVTMIVMTPEDGGLWIVEAPLIPV